MVDNRLQPSPLLDRSISFAKGVPLFKLAENNNE